MVANPNHRSHDFRVLRDQETRSFQKRTVLLPAIAIFVTVLPLDAQVSTGTITGVVSDISGAVVPHAAVTITNDGTNVARKLATDSAGLYSAPDLLPGTYLVGAAGAGLQVETQADLILSIGQIITVNFRLKPAQHSESVVVEATLRAETSTAMVSTLINTQEVAQLPLNGRDFSNLIGFAAGAQPSPPSLFGDVDQFSINGGRQDGNAFLIDGADVVPPGPGTSRLRPNLEAVGELQVATADFTAEYGRSLGGIINVHIKSGANAVHGSLFEFFRNDALDATPLFSPTKAPYRFNQFGGSTGGPIIKNKLFFFGDYQGERIRTSTTVRTTVPEKQETSPVGGYYDFSSVCTTAFTDGLCNDRTGQVYNPFTYPRVPFLSNRIPASLADPITSVMLALLPSPNCITNVAVCGAGNFIAERPNPTNQDSGDGRFDYNPTEMDHLSFVTIVIDSSSYAASIFGPNIGSNLITSADKRAGRMYTLNYTHVLKAQAVNEFVYAYAIDRDDGPPTEGMQYQPRIAGIGDLNTSVSDPQRMGFPAVENGATGTFFGSGLAGPFFEHNNTPQFADNFSWVRARHSFAAGFTARFRESNSLQSFAPRGAYIFLPYETSGLLDNSPVGGDAFASILVGDPFQAQKSIVPQESGERIKEYAAYLQDNLKESSRLSINLGVRWDIFNPATEVHNRIANFDPSSRRMIFSSHGNSASTLDTNYLNFAPRLGFAYQLTSDSKTTIRGGYGISYVPLQFQAIGAPTETNTPFAFNFGPVQYPQNFFASPGSTTVSSGIPVVFPPNRATIPLGATVVYMPKYQPTPYMQQWSLDVQRVLPQELLLDVAYVGTAGIHLAGDQNLNQWPAGSSVAFSPISANIGIVRAILNDEQSNYHALQVKVNRRFAPGFAVQASYVYSRSIDNGSTTIQSNVNSTFPQYAYDLRAERGPSDFNATHRFIAGFLYQLPVGRGRLLFNNSTRLWNALIGGWQINGIVTVQSGHPFTPIYTPGDGVIKAGPSGPESNVRPDVVGDPRRQGIVPANPTCAAAALIHTSAAWFNSCAFTAPVNAFGDAGRNSLVGPSFRNVDLSLFKTVDFRERCKLELRWEVFNAFNHPNLGFPNNQFGTTSTGENFGQILTTTGNPRQIQLALKLSF